METLPIGELARRIGAEESAWVRAVFGRADEDWRLAVAEVTTGDEPPNWGERRWEYANAVLVATQLEGKVVATWLTGRISIDGVDVPLELHDQVSVERRDSRFAPSGFAPLPWPSIEWRGSPREHRNQISTEQLVADGTPAFLNLAYAIAAFLGVPDEPNRSLSGVEFVVRQQDRRARIASVRVRATEILATVDGDELTGTSLTLGGEGGATERPDALAQEVRLPLPDGLQPGSWLALHRDRELLDRRYFDASWGRPANGVEFEIDALTRVEVLIAGGEGESVEFKREVPEGEASSVTKTVAAFANGAGGAILFGVEDDGRIVGTASDRQTIDRLTNLVNDRVRPHIDFNIESTEVDGLHVLVVTVPAGGDPPYGVGTTDRDVRYYVRRGATSFPAAPADVRAVVRSRLPNQADSIFPISLR